MEQLLVNYGPEVAAIATVAIFIVGCLKLIFKKQFEKIDKTKRKTVYETLSILFAFALTAVWLFIEKAYFGGAGFTWEMFGKEGVVVWSATKVAYSLYENFKLRDLLGATGKAIVNLFKKKETKTDEVEDDSNHINVI